MRGTAKGGISRVVVAATLTTLGEASWAGTSDPIGVGGLVGPVLPYLIALVVLAAMGFRSRWALIAAFALLVLPPAWVWRRIEMSGEQERAQRDARNRRVIDEQVAADRAYSQFCKSRQLQVLSTVPPGELPSSGARTLLVSADPAFVQKLSRFRADTLIRLLQSDVQRCRRLGLAFIEGRQSVQPPSFFRSSACEALVYTQIQEPAARYELVVGETSPPAKSPGVAFDSLSSASVRITDRRSGQIMASDTLYFLDFQSGRADCPKAEEQVIDLIERVFSPQSR